MIYLFVYGTLMRGEPLHYWMEDLGAEFVCRTTTDAGYLLVNLGPFPALVDTDGDDYRGNVSGELYKVPEESLPALDHIEGFLVRDEVWLDLEEGRRKVQAYRLPTVPSGDWRQRNND